MIRTWPQSAPDSLWNRFRDKPRMRLASVFHLVWTVYVFGDLIFDRGGLHPYWVLATALSYPAFLALYWLGQTRPMRYVEWFGVGMALLGFATMAFNASGGACYVIYACSYMGVNGTPRQGLRNMALIVAAFLLVARFAFGWPTTVMLAIGFMAFCIGTINLIYRFNARRDAELKLSHDEVRRLAAMAERERIGRDLHDLLGHTLSLITLKLELSRRLMDRDSVAARQEMEEAERVARHALAEVRAAVTGIRAGSIAAELASARLLLNASGVHFDYTNELPTLPERAEAELALILREAVTNIHRHAHASRAEARFTSSDDRVTLCVSDNGKAGIVAEGNGMCGMRERARALGGTLGLESARGAGTRVIVTVPLMAVERLAAPLETGLSLAPFLMERSA